MFGLWVKSGIYSNFLEHDHPLFMFGFGEGASLPWFGTRYEEREYTTILILLGNR
jgi:hypothetical protein